MRSLERGIFEDTFARCETNVAGTKGKVNYVNAMDVCSSTSIYHPANPNHRERHATAHRALIGIAGVMPL